MCSNLILKIKIVLLLYFVIHIKANRYNITDKNLESCRILVLNSGYLYKNFYHINSLANNKGSHDERMRMRFYVKTLMDAHILLSVNDRPRIFDRVYEIVIGAGANTFSTIRLRMGSNRVSTNQDPRLLSMFEVTPIEIVQKKDGTLLVYIVNYQKEPLLQYNDISPLDIHYISFSTYGKITATWYYDCEFDGYAKEVEEVQRVLSPYERLISNITAMAGGANRTMPYDLAMVNFTPQIIGLNYEQHDSMLKTELNFVLSWADERLRWDPKNYNNISMLMQTELDVWTPSLLVINGAKDTLRHFNPNYKLHIRSNGSVYVQATNVELKTWCLNEAHNWPNEHLQCPVHFGLNEFSTTSKDGQLHLNYISDEHSINTLSDWQFVSLDVVSIETNGSNRLDHKGRRHATSGDIVIEFEILRNGDFYKNVFLVPMLASHILLLLSFFLHGYRRGGLILIVIVILTMSFMYITKHAPKHYIPNMMIAYQHMLCIATSCYMLHVCIVWLNLYPPCVKPAACFMSLLHATPTRLLLCMNVADSGVYVNTCGHPWKAVAKALNNLSCIVLSIYLLFVSVFLAAK